VNLINVNGVKKYYDQDTQIQNYFKMYEKGFETYPVNLLRIKIIEKRLKKFNIKSIFDIGCGSCGSMIRLLKDGYTVQGNDFSEKMIDSGKKNLIKAGYNPNLITVGNIEKTETLPKKKFDAVIALGVFPHLTNDKKTLRKIHKMVKNKGKVFIQFRNDLFSAFTVNQYSYDFFLNQVIEKKNLSRKILKELEKFYAKRFVNTKRIRKGEGKITYDKILAKFHNPLTVESELFTPTKFSVDKIHFYHYHALPPYFQNKYPKLFNKLSLKMEKENDWRGNLMASVFVVEATKMS